MKQLKNWTITSKGIKHGQKGLLNYISYLTDTERHKGQTLTNISHNEALKNLLQSHNDFELEKKLETKRHKGGRPSNVGWSSVLSYPFDISNEQFELLKNRISFDFYNYVNETEKLGMSVEDIQSLIDSTIGVIHNGNNVNNHIHMIFNKIMPKHTKNILKSNTKKLTSIDLTKKKYLYNLKIINDKAIEDILKINKADYTIKTTEKPQKKRKTKVQIKMEKLDKREEELKARESAISKREDIIKQLEAKYTKIAKLHNERVEKLLARENWINNEKERMIKYTKEQFDKDMKRHTEYMTKGMTEKAKKLQDKIINKINKTAKSTNRMK